MEDSGSSTPTSSPTSTKGPLVDWQQAWLDRRCLALGLTPQPEPLDPVERFQLYDCELAGPSLEWRDRANDTPLGQRWLRTWYRPLDKVYELSLRASPFLTLIRERDRMLRAVHMSKLFTEIELTPCGTWSAPIRVPASEVEPTRRILW